MSERYEIKATLGRGGMGAVYHAFDTVMKRDVAIKRLLPLEETNLNDSADESLKREAAALARFSHPNVVTIYAFEEDSDGPYVVMEKVDGDDLKVTIAKGALAVEDFVELTEQTLDPLIAAKDLNLLHRDIKPANIMLNWLSTGKFQAKILDFGLAKFSEKPQQQTLDQKGFFLGSIDYLTPEQLQCMALDQRTDLYSLGCVLYFCLVQQSPFHGDNPADTTQRHMKHVCEPIHEVRPDVPKAMADWLMRMISRNRSDRPADARQALEEFLAAKKGISPLKNQSGNTGGQRSVVVISDDEGPEVASRPAPADTDSQKIQIIEDVEEDDIPFAKVADTGPRMILTGDKMLTRPKSGQTGPRTLTGNTSPAGSKSGQTGPRTLTGSTRPTRNLPGQTGPLSMTGATVPVGKQRSTPLMLILIVGSICVVLGALVFLFKGDKQPERERYSAPSKSEATSTKSTGSTSTSAAKITPYKPTFTPQPATQFVSPYGKDLPTPASVPGGPPPVTDGLIAHYHANVGTFGPDLNAAARMNERVAGWANIAGGALPKSDLLLHQEDFELVAVPRLVQSGDKYPNLQPNTNALEFRNSTHLKLHDWKLFEGLEPVSSLSFLAVVRNEKSSATWLRFEGDKRGGFISSNHGGSTLQCHYSVPGKRQTVQIPLPLNEFVLVSYVLDGNKKTHQVRGQTANGKVISSKAEPVQILSAPLRSFSLGTFWKPQTGKNPPGFFTGHVVEFMFFNRALSPTETESLENYIRARTFKVKS